MGAGISAASVKLWRAVAGTELRRNILETYGARLLTVAVTFATAIVVARQLGPTGRGLFAVATTMGALGVQIGNLGLHASNVYFAAKDRALLPALIGNTLAAVLIVGVITAVGGVVLILWPTLSPLHGTLLLLGLASVPIGLAYMLTQGLLVGVNEVRAYNRIECTGKFVALTLVFFLVLIHRKAVEPFLVATVASVMLNFVWALFRLRRVSAEPPALSAAVFWQSVNIGMRAYLIAFFGFLVLRIDLLMVKYMLGATQAGYYSISEVLAENTMMFPVVVGLLLFPKLSALQDRHEKLRLANKSILVTAALMFPVVVIATLAAAPLISIAFGRDFLPAVAPFAWLMPGTYFLGIETVMVQLLNSDGFPPVIVVAWIADTTINVAANFWAIPRYGITGASIVSSVCYFLIFVFVSVIVWRNNYARNPTPTCTPDLST